MPINDIDKHMLSDNFDGASVRIVIIRWRSFISEIIMLVLMYAYEHIS